MQQRSEACMKWFMQEQGRLLAYLCTRMPGVEDAELVLHTTAERVLRAVEHGHLHTDHDSLLRYTLRLLYCAGSNSLRSQSRRHSLEQRYCEQLYGDMTEPHMLREDINDEQLHARRAVFELPQKLREVVILRLWQELSATQTASVLHIPLSTVNSRYATALRMLKDMLNPPTTSHHE
ncbi:MAG: sigma factor-like helix-turn-helix DNA-binding protein [Akkermansia sp.]|nr:sigma factor-like helix-turn-helix DNA-binding protein [Akkermansia sp.]